ncbi:MAG: tetratricopeptide repeat protein, partial [Deltaproteobacteria bacterium]|nr:tetratricopeptide repeat protein [Deltaproteobacteria bacterium]
MLFLTTLLWLPAPLSAATAHHLQRQGVEAYNEGRHEEALHLFSQAVARNPADAAALYNQGTALYKMGQFTEAAQAFGDAAQGHSKPEPRARALYNTGRALLAAAGRAPDQAQKKKLLLDGNQAFQ